MVYLHQIGPGTFGTSCCSKNLTGIDLLLRVYREDDAAAPERNAELNRGGGAADTGVRVGGRRQSTTESTQEVSAAT